MTQDFTIVAFRMQLKPGVEAEYQRRHDMLWPDLRDALTQVGIAEYYIFLDPHTRALFAFQRLTAGSDTSGLANLPVMRRWWDYMADLMDVNPDNSPVVVPCTEVFRL